MATQSTPINQIRRNMNSENLNSLSNPNMSNPNMSNQMINLPTNQGDNMMMNDNINAHQGLVQEPVMNDNQLVEDILKEMNVPDTKDSDTNVQSYNYATDSSQVPPEKLYAQNLSPDPPLTINEPSDSVINNYNDDSTVDDLKKQNESLMSSLGINMSLNDNSSSNKGGLIKKYLILPSIIFIILTLLVLPVFNRFLFSLLPSLLLESGQVSIKGVLLKAFIGTVLYVIISIFV